MIKKERRGIMRTSILIKNIIIYTLLSLGAILMIFPLFWMVTTAFKTMAEASAIPPIWFSKNPQWDSFLEVMIDDGVLGNFLNTLFVSLIVLVAQLFNCSTGAYAFARLQFKGREQLFLLFIGTMMIPMFCNIIPMYLIIQKLNLVNTYAGVIFPYLFMPFGIFLLRQAFIKVPVEMEESVIMDGGGYFRCYWSLILPLCRPPLSVTSSNHRK
jgi:multiple sugar transport system permease protein